MADLPEDQQPKQPQVPDLPVSDQPPLGQSPGEEPTTEEPSFPPMQDGEKPVTPKQEEIKEELSELGIPPGGAPKKKTKILLAALGIFLLIATLPAAIYLVKQRQEFRKEAEVCGPCPQIMPPAPDFCLDGTIIPGTIDECGCRMPPTCQRPSPTPTLPIENCPLPNQCVIVIIGPREEPKCPGGEDPLPYTCLPVGAPNMVRICCPTVIRPTPTLRPTPTPTIPGYTARCEFCKVYDEDWVEITNPSTIEVGQTIYFATRGSTTHPQGIIKARFRINEGIWQETTSKHGNEFYIPYTIPATGSYTVESMVYNPSLGWY